MTGINMMPTRYSLARGEKGDPKKPEFMCNFKFLRPTQNIWGYNDEVKAEVEKLKWYGVTAEDCIEFVSITVKDPKTLKRWDGYIRNLFRDRKDDSILCGLWKTAPDVSAHFEFREER